MTFLYNVPCIMGAESLVADELSFNGFSDVRAENGRVLFSGDVKEGARANLWLRCGERVLLVVGSFYARTFTELFDNVYSLEWESFIPRDGAFPVVGYSVASTLFSVPDCQSIIKKAIAKRLGEKNGLQRLPETGAQYKVRFSILKDRVEVALDTSGDPLHKRGYRKAHTEASMKETLAASIIKVARFKGREEFIDPMCGAGTLPIEAAMASLKMAPGQNRSFDMEKWQLMPAGTMDELRQEALEKREEKELLINAFDIDPDAVLMAKDNAVRAGVDKYIKFSVGDAAKLSYPAEGVLMTDPPYGVRLMDTEKAKKLVEDFGKAAGRTALKKYILTADDNFEEHFGVKADKKRKLYNGMIKCNLYMYFKN